MLNRFKPFLSRFINNFVIMNKYNQLDLNKILDNIPREFIEKQNQLIEEENDRVFNDFIQNLEVGKCFMCKEKMNSFIPDKPCFHWFAYPNGIKKKNFESYLSNPIGFFKLDCYFRWLANTDRFFCNINDFKNETSLTSQIETTYKYQNIEWAISIGNTDLEGHENASIGKYPHFHIQMKVDDRIFLRFNDFHIPLSDSDLLEFELRNQLSDRYDTDYSYGIGMGFLEDPNNLEAVYESQYIDFEKEDGVIRLRTLIKAPEGEFLSGDKILEAYEISKKTNEPVGKILKRLLPEADFLTVMSPNNGIEKIKRSGKK